MNVIDWSLSALDTIFSRRKASPGEAKCPDGTGLSGFVRDNWSGNWQVLCIEPLTVEDVEDLFIFGFMVAGFLLSGFGFAFVYRKICQTGQLAQTLSDNNKLKLVELGERMTVLENRLTHGLSQLVELNRNILLKTERIAESCGTVREREFGGVAQRN